MSLQLLGTQVLDVGGRDSGHGCGDADGWPDPG